MMVTNEFSGAFLVDKESEWSSAQVVRVMKRWGGFKKVGHAGTLDPMATGLLVVLVGAATKLQDYIMGGEKEYHGVIKLGIQTDTDDVTGEIIAQSTEAVDLGNFGEPNVVSSMLCEHFIGAIDQVPPVYSAIHVNGKRSYALARKGKPTTLAPRTVSVSQAEFEILDSDKIGYKIVCSKGTYIRSIARDVGEFLGTFGTLDSIRRVRCDDLHVDDARAVEYYVESSLETCLGIKSVEELVSNLKRVELSDVACNKLRLGDQRVLREIQNIERTDSKNVAAVYDSQKTLCAIIENVQDVDLELQGELQDVSPWRIKCVM